MRVPSLRRLFCIFCGFLVFLPPETLMVAWQAGPGSPSFSITISTPEATIKSGTELIVNVIFTNVSDHPANLGLDEVDYRTEVRDEQNELARPTQYGRTLAGRDSQFATPREQSFVTVPLQPGETTKAQINVSRWFDLSWPGKYTISVQGYDRENKALMQSNMISVAVVQVQCAPPPVSSSSTPIGTQPTTQPPVVSVTLSTKRHHVKAGSEILIEESVTNLSRDPIAISPYYAPGLHVKNVFEPQLDLKDSGGCPVKPGTERRFENRRFLVDGALKPHETRKNSYVISDWRDFHQPGVYTVQKIFRDQKTSQAIASNILTITVFEDCVSYGGPISSDVVYSVDRPARTPVGTVKRGQPVYGCKTTSDFNKKACPPLLLRLIDPVYTDEARQAEVTGTVVVGFLIDNTGKTAEVRELESLGKGLDEQAVAAVKQWKYRPGLYKGAPFSLNAKASLEFGCKSAKYPRELR